MEIFVWGERKKVKRRLHQENVCRFGYDYR